jgi:hypothetical protein
MKVGVGTCVTPEDIEYAKKIGGDFAVSANFSWDNLKKADELGLFYLPSVGTLGEFQKLITGEKKSPEGKTVQELLGGRDIATLKVHPGGEGNLIDLVNATIMNDYQKAQQQISFVQLCPSSSVQDGFDMNRIAAIGAKKHVAMIGGTTTYVMKDADGDYHNLIQEGRFDDITELARYAKAVVHGEVPAPLPEHLQDAVGGGKQVRALAGQARGTAEASVTLQ